MLGLYPQGRSSAFWVPRSSPSFLRIRPSPLPSCQSQRRCELTTERDAASQWPRTKACSRRPVKPAGGGRLSGVYTVKPPSFFHCCARRLNGFMHMKENKPALKHHGSFFIKRFFVQTNRNHLNLVNVRLCLTSHTGFIPVN